MYVRTLQQSGSAGKPDVMPTQPGHAEQRTHDYVRHGTTTLFAALEIATGKVTGVCKNGIGTKSSWPSSNASPGHTPTASCTW
jgi:hypothetical protein